MGAVLNFGSCGGSAVVRLAATVCMGSAEEEEATAIFSLGNCRLTCTVATMTSKSSAMSILADAVSGQP